MSIFLDSLRHQLALNGFHAPIDCRHHIAPRDKKDEVRCPRCSVLMCDESDMPMPIKQSLRNAFGFAAAKLRNRGLDVDVIAEDLEYANCRVEALLETIAWLRDANTKVRNKLLDVRGEKCGLRDQKNELGKQVAQLLAENSKLLSDNDELRASNKKLSAHSKHCAIEKGKFETTIMGLDAKLNSLSSENTVLVADNDRLLAANKKLREHSMKMAAELREIGATIDNITTIAKRIDIKLGDVVSSKKDDSGQHPFVVTTPTGRSMVEDHFLAPKSDAQEPAFDGFGQPIVAPSHVERTSTEAPCGHPGRRDPRFRSTILLDEEVEALDQTARLNANMPRIEDRDALFLRREAEYYDRNFIYPRRLNDGNYAKRTKEEAERASVVAMKTNLSIDRFVAYYGLDHDAVSFIDNSSFLDFLIRMYRLFKIHYDIDLENVEPHIIKAVIDQERQFIRVARHSSALGRAKSRMSDLQRLYEMIVGRRRK